MLLENKKTDDIVLIDVSNTVTYTDYIIIGTASSKRLLNALSDAIIFNKIDDRRIKGKKNGDPDSGWVVIDYGDLVIHLFNQEIRQFYLLLELWKNGKILIRLK